MWIRVYERKTHKIEKNVEGPADAEDRTKEDTPNSFTYRSAREYISECAVGRYRLLDRESDSVLCGSWSFDRLLKWAEEGLPGLFESVSLGLCVGVFVKAYESSENVVILGSTGLCVFTRSSQKVVPYKKIRKVVSTGKVEIHAENDSEQGAEVLEVSPFPELPEEVLTLSLQPVGEEDAPNELVLRRISERVCATVPLYGQGIKCVIMHESGSISVTEDFLIVRESPKYLLIPLCMLRKVELAGKGILTIRDANCREFVFRVGNSEGVHLLLNKLVQDDRSFKSAYFSVFLDMLRISHRMQYDLERGSNWALGSTSEYRIYVCIKTEETSPSPSRNSRPFVWMGCFCLCGMASTPDLYENSLEKSKRVFYGGYEQAEKDAFRVCTGDSADVESMRRLLCAFTAFAGGEYLQSHGMIASVLYRVLGETGTFFGIVHIFSRILPGYTGPEIYGLGRDLSVFVGLAREKYPGLCKNLAEKSIDLEVLVSPWFLGLFSTLFQRRQIEVVFDHIAYFGVSFVFKLALSLLERMYRGLSRSQGTGSILKASAQYFFENKSTPRMEEKEFAALLRIARADTFASPESIHYRRQQYEISHRRLPTFYE
ncbi:uncharacterized protein NEMAJ01_1831 [Nematocida major]|uniref:uncharacterized protein n=1 Tax=Nematocida major TaxID=1912982 RepID=UPI0020087127|nr:uncharacterized protein NEMAJ01_1831 [Nematocida major]KAH9386935.1 hypothetical protein NEMAJ01_1831 [Nematocida major]